MEHASFSQPVEVKALAIAGADQAATYLFEYWPVVEGKCYELAKLACIDAQRACLDVMAGAASQTKLARLSARRAKKRICV
ncbi:DUF982 domain-containing protein [Labrys sp. La1]|uniref:hypothetical protein n=1 Tax=Labrys sp. La1 TaxID=3404917 RepID=UPI003EB98C11